MRIAVCDDNRSELEHLQRLLDEYKNIRGLSIDCQVFESGVDLLFYMKGGEYDIIFLDIIMAGMNGIETAREIRDLDKNVKLGFLSSSSEFAVDSYSVRAGFYLLKPVLEDRLFPILDRMNAELCSPNQDFLAIKSKSGFMRLPFDKLEYLEIMNKTIFFHMTDGSVHESTGTLSDYEEKLLPRSDFFKIHRSYLVNLKQIQNLSGKGAVLCTGHILPVSRALYVRARDAYMNFMFQHEENMEYPQPLNNREGEKAEPLTGSYRVLYVDDDRNEQEYWSSTMREKGCEVHNASGQKEAIRLAQTHTYDCILLDVRLENENGFNVCRNLKNLTDSPVIFFSCLTDQESQLLGFEAGGQDYITKDCTTALFWAKLETYLRLFKQKNSRP